MVDDLPEMVKRIASELSDELGDAVAPELCIALAERALKAIREPTGRMWSAGRSRFAAQAERYRQQTTSEEADIYADTAPADIWRAMIDAALS